MFTRSGTKNTGLPIPDVFPYSIHFYIDKTNNRMVIIGVVHSSRDFDFLKQRG